MYMLYNSSLAHKQSLSLLIEFLARGKAYGIIPFTAKPFNAFSRTTILIFSPLNLCSSGNLMYLLYP